MDAGVDVIVCGHLCLDLIPKMDTVPLAALASPGKLFEVGALEMSTGGAVSNTGLALHRLGANVRLLSAVGDDLLGRVIIAFLKDRDAELAELVNVKAGFSTSYSVLLSPENADRIVLHNAGTNTTFTGDDVDFSLVTGAKLFHLGYPPLLPGLLVDDGAPLAELFRRARAEGPVTSLDMALPDPGQPAGRMDWRTILRHALPHIDVFIPSIEESIFMLRRADYDSWGGTVIEKINRAYLSELADELLAMGTAVVGFKLGEMGLYLKTGTETSILSSLSVDVRQWTAVELWVPAFHVNVVGTTGAGDSAYAGFLAAMLHGFAPLDAMRWACAVGGCNVEAADSTSGILTWEATQSRLDSGWPVSDKRLPGF